MPYLLNDTAFCVEYFYAKQGYKNQLIDALLKLVEPTRSEPGCLQYDLMQDNKDSNLIILIVKFANKEMMKKHENQPFVKDFAENEMKKYCERFTWNDALGISNGTK